MIAHHPAARVDEPELAEQFRRLIPVAGCLGKMPADVLQVVSVVRAAVPAVSAFRAVSIEQIAM